MTDWQVGDLALCIKRDEWLYDNGAVANDLENPEFGEVYLVDGLRMFERELYLVLEGFEQVGDDGLRESFFAPAFRKIRPSSIEHIEALKRLPVKESEDA